MTADDVVTFTVFAGHNSSDYDHLNQRFLAGSNGNISKLRVGRDLRWSITKNCACVVA